MKLSSHDHPRADSKCPLEVLRCFRVTPRIRSGSLAIVLVLTFQSPSVAQDAAMARFREALINYFKPLNYFPVLVNRGYAVGDVINIDGVNVYARARKCFPTLKPPAPNPTSLADILQTDAGDLNFGLRLRRLFDSSAGLDLARQIHIRFNDVTTVVSTILDLRNALDRGACPDIAPIVDGTVSAGTEQPFFVVSEVLYGRREATLSFEAGGSATAAAARITRAAGDATLVVKAAGSNMVSISSDVIVPIAVRPVTVPRIVELNSFEFRGGQGSGVQWESCQEHASCAPLFSEFAQRMINTLPQLNAADFEQ